MEPSASSGQTKRLFHRKSIATIDAIEHVLNVANSYFTYKTFVDGYAQTYNGLTTSAFLFVICFLIFFLRFLSTVSENRTECVFVSIFC
jgi:uncharacterized membrane protein (DUF373 family)